MSEKQTVGVTREQVIAIFVREGNATYAEACEILDLGEHAASEAMARLFSVVEAGSSPGVRINALMYAFERVSQKAQDKIERGLAKCKSLGLEPIDLSKNEEDENADNDRR